MDFEVGISGSFKRLETAVSNIRSGPAVTKFLNHSTLSSTLIHECAYILEVKTQTLRLSIDFGKVGDGGASIRKPFAGQAHMHTGNLRNLMAPFGWGIQIKIKGKTTPYEERHFVHSVS